MARYFAAALPLTSIERNRILDRAQDLAFCVGLDGFAAVSDNDSIAVDRCQDSGPVVTYHGAVADEAGNRIRPSHVAPDTRLLSLVP